MSYILDFWDSILYNICLLFRLLQFYPINFWAEKVAAY